jgi:hypothetical protein
LLASILWAVDRIGRINRKAMQTWRRRDRAQRIEAKAKALIETFGDDAYTEARRPSRYPSDGK